MAGTLIRWLLALTPAFGCMFAMRGLVHYFQLESYQFPGYFHAIRRKWKQAFMPGLAISVLTFALLECFNTLVQVSGTAVEITTAACLCVVSALGGLWLSKIMKDRNAKKPLVFTPRVKRLYGVMAVLWIAIAAIAVYVWLPVVAILALIPLALPYLLALAGLLAWPIEKAISEMYFRDARRKLNAMEGLIKIGITGSYGKTSVKFILGTLLEEKFNVLITPNSFNTPMGVTRVIREKLQPAHQVFVAEMGARHKGDIKELCRLVHPTLGVITSVGPQHLETFGTLERVVATKYELVEGLPSDGQAFFQDDQDISRGLYQRTEKPKTLVSIYSDDADVWATDITPSPLGTTFTLHTKDGETAQCQTLLLGEHNIQNILMAVAVCRALRMTMAQILRGIAKLKPVEHRLQLITSAGGGMTVIDDAYNSNPKGTAAALKVLGQFPGRRIIITPGMVELGSQEARYNQEFGAAMAKSVDVAVLIGKKHTRPIVTGLKEAGFPESAIHVVASLEESSALIRNIARPGDVLLYENDLPDHYNEG